MLSFVTHCHVEIVVCVIFQRKLREELETKFNADLTEVKKAATTAPAPAVTGVSEETKAALQSTQEQIQQLTKQFEQQLKKFVNGLLIG